jgi:hypothetical protein
MRKLFSYPGLPLLLLSATYVLAFGPAGSRRALLSLVVATSVGVGELTVSALGLFAGDRLSRWAPRILIGIGALTFGAAPFFRFETTMDLAGSLVFLAGLLWWTVQLRQKRWV